MGDDAKKVEVVKKKICSPSSSSGSNAVYCLGLIGAAIYFIQNAGSFWGGVLGVIKAFLWPIMVVYKLLELLKL